MPLEGKDVDQGLSSVIHKRVSWGKAFLLVVAFLLLSGVNYLFVKTLPGQVDFLNRWLPVRLILFEGYEDIYGEDISEQVQLVYHGRLADEGDIQGFFAYPYFTAALYLPFALIDDFFIAASLFLSCLEIIHIAIVFISLKLLKKQLPFSTMSLLFLFVLGSVDMMYPLVYGNPSSISALFMILSLYFLDRRQDTAAGVFLALSTFKPQTTMIFFLIVWLWAFSHRRWRVILSSIGVLIILYGGSFLIQPDWMEGFLSQILRYPQYARPNTPERLLEGAGVNLAQITGYLLSGISIVLISVEAFLVYQKNFRHLFWTICLSYAVLPLSGIPSTKGNLIYLLPAFILLLVTILESGKRGTLWMNSAILTFFCAGWGLLLLCELKAFEGCLSILQLVFPTAMLLLLYIIRRTSISSSAVDR